MNYSSEHSLLVLFTVPARLPFSVVPALHGPAWSPLVPSRDICCGIGEVKERGCWRRCPNISLGFLFFPPSPRLGFSFPGGTWAVDFPRGVFSAGGLLGMTGLFLLHATWGDITRARVIFLPDTSSLTWKMNFCPACMWCCPFELFSV